MTRREWSKRILLGIVPARIGLGASRQCSLRNEKLQFAIALGEGKVVSRTFQNRLTGEIVDLPKEEFALEFADGTTVHSTALQAGFIAQTAKTADILYVDNGGTLEVRVRYDLPAARAYLRKQIWVRRKSGEGRLLRADLEIWQGVKRAWNSMRTDPKPYGSHPIFCDSMWAGVEFVAAFNEYSSDGFVLRSRPGGKLVGAEWLALHSTVAGVAEPNAVREAFLSYIDDVRLSPPRLVACYNSWWSLPLRFKHEEHLALMRDLKQKLFDKHGAFFDLVATDEGWTDPHTIWEVDPRSLPDGFTDTRAIVESAGGKLGLWMSPSEIYPRSCDYDWAERSGYVVKRIAKDWATDDIGSQRGTLSLADPKYRKEAEKQLTKLIRENGFGHIKYDGFVGEEKVPHHGLLPGIDSVEPLAEYLLELITVTRQAGSGLVTEPTCLSSVQNYTSPWLIKYADTEWAGGSDCPPGLGPAPVHREAHTSGREYRIFSSLKSVWLPQNALQYFDIIHCDDSAGFPNHAAMAFGRGRFFVPTYANPKLMSGEDWRIYAGLLRWARANRDVLRNTVVLPSRVELGEPYVYAHWLGSRGILAVRNPSNESREFQLDLRRAGAPPHLAGAVCYTQYPYRKGIAAQLNGNTTLPLRLSPWELVFLEIVPVAELREPVAIGARWFQDSSHGMAVVPDRNADRVRLIQPGGREQVVSVRSRTRAEFRGELVSEAIRELPEPEWVTQEKTYSCVGDFSKSCPATVPVGQCVPSVAFDIECSVSIPHDAVKGRVLLLVEFPGEKHWPSRCAAVVNGENLPLEESHSAGHLAYRDNRWYPDVRAYASEWTWYIGEVPKGSSRVRFRGAAGDLKCRIGLWTWCDSDLSGSSVPVALRASEPAMPQYQPNIESEGICLKPSRPV